MAHGTAFPLCKLNIETITKPVHIFVFLVLLIFGNLTDIFTNRSFDLCNLNMSLFDPFCEPGVHLTPENFFNEIQYVFNCVFSLSIFRFFHIICLENVTYQQYQILRCRPLTF